jgi:hypothetical protein
LHCPPTPTLTGKYGTRQSILLKNSRGGVKTQGPKL